jgi:hypothetical protein
VTNADARGHPNGEDPEEQASAGDEQRSIIQNCGIRDLKQLQSADEYRSPVCDHLRKSEEQERREDEFRSVWLSPN